MKFSPKKSAICLSALFLFASSIESSAFALLGPVQPWMQTSNGVIYSSDIGGPMCISNEYRWNVPVVTYGFDQSFLNYFGSNGVAAVESAIQILNNLPPASQIALTNYSYGSQGANYAAADQSLSDLKSETLSLLLEQMGLAQPTRYMFVIQQWNPLSIIQLNFDPQTLAASTSVNSTLYSYNISTNQNGQHSIESFLVDPLTFNPAVADFNANGNVGYFYIGLTYDDVGGLAYLLSTNIVNYETLLSGVVGVGTNANSFVNGAWRPGVDKITFIPQPVASQSGTFLATTNFFTDKFITNGILQQQQMARVISQPDFLFCAGDVTSGEPETSFYAPSGFPDLPFYARTGTTNWLNNAIANGNTNGAGPGVIQPQVQIVFNKLGPLLISEGSTSDEQVSVYSLQYWASFDDSTNAPVIYPISQTGTNQMIVRMWLERGSNPNWTSQSFTWKPSSLSGSQFAMQTSTNLINWITLFMVTNNSSVTTYLNINPASASRFYRLVPP